MLTAGQRLRTQSGLECVVGDYIGHGLQGEVYHVTVGRTRLALKWYYPTWRERDVDLRSRLEKIIECGSPSDRFLWPIEIVVDAEGAFGYVMPARTPAYHSLTSLLAGRVSPTFRAIATASFELAHNYHLLHAEGLSYQDVSDGNVWIDEDTGAIEISDCDNVCANGVAGQVEGTPGYIAPEILVSRDVPSWDTDRHSLAVLIFQMLVLHQPMIGAAELNYPALTPDALYALNATHPVFIFDPDDDSNRPVPGRHDNALIFWPLYPGYIRELFVRAFTVGLRSPGERPHESEWRRRLLRMRDAIVRCQACASENFYDEKRDGGAGCWSCQTALVEPMRLKIEPMLHSADGSDVVLNTDTKLHEHHLDAGCQFQFDRVLASVSRHPTQPDVWGLRNDSDLAWTVTTAGGATEMIAPRRVARLDGGLRIDFGKRRGAVVAPKEAALT